MGGWGACVLGSCVSSCCTDRKRLGGEKATNRRRFAQVWIHGLCCIACGVLAARLHVRCHLARCLTQLPVAGSPVAAPWMVVA